MANPDSSIIEITSDGEAKEATAWVAAPIIGPKPVEPNYTDWILDSGATTHICPYCQLFGSYHKFNLPRPIGTADHGSFQANGIGNF